jgi:hypothetical protein
MLDSPAEIKSLKIGFQTFTTDFNDKVLGIPPAIHLEAGPSQNALSPIGHLDMVCDEAFSNHCVKVFSINLQKANLSERLEQQ